MLRLERFIKRLLRLLDASERGDAMIMALITLAVGSAIIVPTLNHVNTGVKFVAVHEQITRETYAADAGVEYALWYLKNGGDPDAVPSPITFDGMSVAITCTERTGTLYGVVISDSNVHSDYLVITNTVEDIAPVGDGLFQFTINLENTSDSKKMKIEKIGIWVTNNFAYEGGTTSGDFAGHYDVYPDDEDSGDIVWELDDPDLLDGESKDHIFEIQGPVAADTEDLQAACYSWIEVQSQDIGIVSSLWAYDVTATVNSGTNIETIVIKSGTYVYPLSWQIN